MARISSPGESPAFCEGVPGSVCSTITRPGSIDTTLPKPLDVEVSMRLSCSNCSGAKKTECGSSFRNMAGMAPAYMACSESTGSAAFSAAMEYAPMTSRSCRSRSSCAPRRVAEQSKAMVRRSIKRVRCSSVTRGPLSANGVHCGCSGRITVAMVEIQPIRVEIEHEEDGRILATVPDLPGVMAYGGTEDEAVRKVKSIGLQVLADSGGTGE